MRDGLWGATGLLFRFRIHCPFRHSHALAFEEYKELGAPVYKVKGLVRGWLTKAEALVTNSSQHDWASQEVQT